MGGASSGAGGGDRGGTGNVAGNGGPGGAGGWAGAPCSDSVPCPAGSFCERDAPSACDAATTAGHCIVPPKTCFLTVTPTCGCDGTPHYNDCPRRAFSVHVDPAMHCPPNGNDGGTLGTCPTCERATRYCEMKRVGPLAPPYFSACRPLPAACSANPTSCDCLANVSCGQACNTTLGIPVVFCLPP